MEKVYLRGGPFDDEVREVKESDIAFQFSPGHVPYKDRGQINRDGRRIFVYEPGENDQGITQTLTATGDASAASPGASA